MEPESRDQADHPFRHGLGHLCKTVIQGVIGLGKLIEAAADTQDGAVFRHPSQCLIMDPGRLQLRQPHDAVLAKESDRCLSLRFGAMRGHVMICRLLHVYDHFLSHPGTFEKLL